MRVVGVSRILNEADIVEPFMRHHAALLDEHIVLDGGSTDATVPILQALHADGMRLQLYQIASPVFVEQLHNTGLYRLALQAGADWVVFLDADELLHTRGADRPADVLALVPGDVACLRIPVFMYRPGAPHPLLGLRHRDPAPHMHKVFARRLDPARVAIYAGSHGAFIDGVADHGLSQDRLMLAHAHWRSPLQMARKTILGRLRALASGANIAAEMQHHLVEAFEMLKRDPRSALEHRPPTPDSVEEPAPYRGEPLRCTQPPDELARLLSLLTQQAEALAQSHGGILDRKRLIRREMLEDANRARRLL